MLKQSQSIGQRQSLQQRLSPQQIQYIKLLQLPTLMLEQRVKQELETNPVLELDDDVLEEQTDEFSEDESLSDAESSPESTDDVETADTDESAETEDSGETASEQEETGGADDELTKAADESNDIDWDSYFYDHEGDYTPAWNKEQEEWTELPKPYKSSFMEQLENQVDLLDLNERQQKVADQIIGSIDSDGYLRRDLNAIIDAVAFNDGIMITDKEAEEVLQQIQRLDPPGIAARNLRECLMVQLEVSDSSHPAKKTAMDILQKTWPQFEKKHYDKIRRKLNLSEEQLRQAYQVIMQLDPKPGESDEYLNPDEFIVPDFEVYYEEAMEDSDDDDGGFVIRMNERNMPNIRISRHYRQMWESMKGKGESAKNSDHTGSGDTEKSGEATDASGAASQSEARGTTSQSGASGATSQTDTAGAASPSGATSQTGSTSQTDHAGQNVDENQSETRRFIRDKMESARWFIESIRQRRHTLMAVMRTIVALQEEFFRTGKGIRPMILKDIADRIGMDISTVSRVVNGKYVQTPFGVYELKYFFSEGMETEAGDAVSNREIKNILLELVDNEDKSRPLSDQALAKKLAEKGYPVARRTISKYREQLNIPVARMRRDIG